MCVQSRKSKEQKTKHNASRRASQFVLFTKHSRGDEIKTKNKNKNA
jgi:hypothetical protein